MLKTCLLVIDVQSALTKQLSDEIFINNLQKLIAASRKHHLEVIYVRHHDEQLVLNTPGWQIDSRITPCQDDKIFDKEDNSIFKNTGLDTYLKEQGIESLIITGMQSEYCIDTSVRVAFELGYHVIIPSQATRTFDNDYFKASVLQLYLEQQMWNQRFGQVVEFEQVLKMIEANLEYRFSTGKEAFDDAKMIRQAVFVEEQGFKQEFDEIDDQAIHLVIYRNNAPIAVGRMYQKDEKTVIFGRIATMKNCRHQHLGSQIVKALEQKGRELGYQQVSLSAQQRAQGFYEKLGYQIEGKEYYDEWCLHITMKKLL